MNNSAELTVRLDLRARGFDVSATRRNGANGVDLTAMKNGIAITIEVKNIVNGRKSKTVKPVQKSGLRCDWIALVFGSEIIYQPMRDHLKCCGKTGTRGVTELLKLRQMLIAVESTGDTK